MFETPLLLPAVKIYYLVLFIQAKHLLYCWSLNFQIWYANYVCFKGPILRRFREYSKLLSQSKFGVKLITVFRVYLTLSLDLSSFPIHFIAVALDYLHSFF